MGFQNPGQDPVKFVFEQLFLTLVTKLYELLECRESFSAF